ncbi:hypothetical protein CFK38_05245 [Brachybacterium vulturis]|uniref:Phosphonomutase n=1 Tax=Brachybacterium vulturis TaxID=2017484 RepID=A0A291GLQ7_9MICO|nr:isocitrate lyase/phosphoenolpyruvate mutase family protein [Brachybacterium vulturis]ATG51002.1 hypothetical protein CFK38_05245 [Brachybacterium vulturis]
MPAAHPDSAARKAFAALHRPGDPFLLPNAWDVASALALHRAGFPAVGTTSLGIAAAAGLHDGHGLTLEHTRLALARIAVAVPEVLLTGDLENGYRDDPQQVAELLDDLPVVGVNLEDSAGGSLTDAVAHAAKITAVSARHPEVFLNARVDTFWTGRPDLAETFARISRYADAGAEGIFVPGDLPLVTIAEITRFSPLPVNVLASSRWTRADAAEAGVARISTGSLPYRAALTAAVRTAEALRDGTDLPVSDPLGYAATEALLPPHG